MRAHPRIGAAAARLVSRAGPGDDGADRKGVQVLTRALTVLGAFSKSEPFLNLADLTRRTGVNKATLLRLIATLRDFDYVRQTPAGLYHVGPAALRLSGLYRTAVSDGDIIHPTLLALVQKTGESASFNVREGSSRVCIYRVNSPSKIRDQVEVGDVLPLEKGAAGKVLLAFSSQARNPALDAVRAGYVCATQGEIERDAAAVAVPVFREDGIAGALALTGPALRFGSDAQEAFKACLFDAALRLTQELGGDVRAMRHAWKR